MKKIVMVGVLALQLIMLAACGSQKSNASSDSDNSANAKSSSLASLKRENKRLKAKQETNRSSTQSSSSSDEKTSAQAESSAVVTSSSSSTQPSGPTTGPAGETAQSMRDSLASEFGCNTAALQSVPDSTLVQQYTAAEGAGEDIAGFYNRIHSAYPSIGGNVMGQNPNSSSTNDN